MHQPPDWATAASWHHSHSEFSPLPLLTGREFKETFIQHRYHLGFLTPCSLHVSCQYFAVFQIYYVCKNSLILYPNPYPYPFRYNLEVLPMKRWSLFLHFLNLGWPCHLHGPIKGGGNDVMPVSDLGLEKPYTWIPISPGTLPLS